MEAVLNQKDDLYIAGKKKVKKSRALMRTSIITKSGDAEEIALFLRMYRWLCPSLYIHRRGY